MLFRMKEDHGIDLGSAPGREPGGEQSGQAEEETDSKVNGGIQRVDFEEDTPQHP